MKTPRQLAPDMAEQPFTEVRESLRVLRWGAQKRAKRYFEVFSAANYLTAIEQWQNVQSDFVEIE